MRVPFRGGYLLAAQVDGRVFVPIRPVTEPLGLTMRSQLPKLRSKPWATIREILMVAEDGRAREMVCLDLRSLPLWLATIDAAKVKPEVRPALLALQLEAAEVPFLHFLAPVEASPPGRPPEVDAKLAEFGARLEQQEAALRRLQASGARGGGGAGCLARPWPRRRRRWPS